MKAGDLKNELLDFCQKINTEMDTAFRPSLKSHNLTVTQARILFQVYGSEKATIGSLCDIVNTSSGNASTACKKLERKGLIRRIRDTEDERVVNLQLTEMGLHAVLSIDRDLDRRYSRYLASKPEDSLKEIMADMKKLECFLQELESSQD